MGESRGDALTPERRHIHKLRGLDRTPMTPRLFSRALLLVLLASALPACDSDGDDALADGTFDAQVTGDTEANLRGQALFAVQSEGGQTISAIALINTEDDQDAAFLVIDGQATARTFPVADDEAGAVLVLHGTGNEGDLYIAESGSITLTRSDTGRMTGTFDVTAVNIVDEGDEVRLRGSFNAKPGTVNVPGEE